MYRTQLLNDLVAIDARINEATSRAAHIHNDREFEGVIVEIRELRAQRAAILAKLDDDKHKAL